MHTFTISSAQYDTSLTGAAPPANNPTVTIYASVDNVQYVFGVSWSQIHTSYSAGGTAALRSVLGPLLLNSATLARIIVPCVPQQPIPAYSGAVPAPQGPSAVLGWQSVPEVTNCGSWQS